MQRWEIVNFFIQKNNFKTYLEIGYYQGGSFDQVYCKSKLAVDPNPCKFPKMEEWKHGHHEMFEFINSENPEGIRMIACLVKLTSDEFFMNLRKSMVSKKNYKFDIVFIDGLHERKQVLRDLKNAFTYLSVNGIIIMHDCNPPEYLHTTSGINRLWTGDVYKAMLDQRYSLNVNSYVIDTDWGVGVLRPNQGFKKRDITSTQHYNAITDWEYFSKNRKELLDLVDISTFLKREGELKVT
jgi:Methyltransferase domain